jgi:hypothetical protein
MPLLLVDRRPILSARAWGVNSRCNVSARGMTTVAETSLRPQGAKNGFGV